MRRKSILLDFSSDVLVLISEYAGALALHELFKVGDRLLLAKLFESPYFTSYSNVTEFGVPTYWSETVVKKFRRLKKLHLVSPTTALVGQKPSWSFFRKLPPTLEEIRVHSSAALERWYRSPSKFESPFNFASQFPALKSLTLSYPEPDKWDYEDDYAIEWTWASQHFPSFPDSLETLDINIPVRGMWSHACQLKSLTSLSLRILEDDNFLGFSIFTSLPLLNDLTISGLVDWYLLGRENIEPSEPHRHLKILKLEDLQNFHYGAQILNVLGFNCLMHQSASLETLWVPQLRLSIPTAGDIYVAKRLKSLHCRLEPLNHINAGPCTWDTLKLEEMVLLPMHVATLYLPTNFLVSLPQHLRVLHLHDLSLTMEDLDLLPRGLIELSFYSLESMRDWDSIIRKLPPNLTTLTFTHQNVYDILTFNDYLPLFSPHLQFIHNSSWTLFRAKDLTKSILNTGWTSLIHAAAMCDLESMYYLLCNTPQENLCAWIPKLLASAEETVHPESWRWLLSRGFFTNPPQTNQVDNSVILYEISQEQKSQLLDNLASLPDLVLPSSLLHHLCYDRFLELFKYSINASKTFEKPAKISELILQALGEKQFKIADFLCFDLKFNYIDMKGFMLCIIHPGNNKQEDCTMASAVTWLREKELGIENMHISGVQATPESLFECLMQIMTPGYCHMALLKLLSYLVKQLGVDPHTVLETGRYTRLSHIVCPVIPFSPEPAWHLKAVRWMYKYGVKIIPTKINKNGRFVWTSIANIAYQCNNTGLLALLAFKGHKFRDKVGTHGLRLLDSMDSKTRVIVTELMKEVKDVTKRRPRKRKHE